MVEASMSAQLGAGISYMQLTTFLAATTSCSQAMSTKF